MKKLSQKDKTIHDQFSTYGKNVKEWMNKCVLLLPQIEKNEIWAKKGFPNIYEYARKLAGMSRNKVNESLRILGKAEHLPAIMEVIERKGIFAVKPVVNIATKETEQFWAKRISEMRKSTLETFVKDYKAAHQQISDINMDIFDRHDSRELEHVHSNSGRIDVGTLGRLGAGQPAEKGFSKPNYFQRRSEISIKVEPEVLEALKKIKGNNDWNETMKKLLKYSQKELDLEQKQHEAEEKKLQEELIQEKPEAIKTNNHAVTTAIKKYLIKRSKGICEYPNCSKPGKNIHHTEPFALKKVHDPDQLAYLCEEHHQIIHLGYIDDSRPTTSWYQIEKLPSYDLKNVINQRIAEYKH